MERQMLTSEPSYFDFLMKRRSLRRTRVPFAQAAGVMPEVKPHPRTRRPERMPSIVPNGTIPVFGETVSSSL
jgi:hypothetical protein